MHEDLRKKENQKNACRSTIRTDGVQPNGMAKLPLPSDRSMPASDRMVKAERKILFFVLEFWVFCSILLGPSQCLVVQAPAFKSLLITWSAWEA